MYNHNNTLCSFVLHPEDNNDGDGDDRDDGADDEYRGDDGSQDDDPDYEEPGAKRKRVPNSKSSKPQTRTRAGKPSSKRGRVRGCSAIPVATRPVSLPTMAGLSQRLSKLSV